MPPLKNFKRFDARPILARGEKPLPAILAAAQGLKPGQGLLVIAPFLPAPLIELFRSEGWLSEAKSGKDGHWRVYFWRDNVKGSC